MKPILERFFENVSPADENECWIWIGATRTGTYGQYGGFSFERKKQPSHRIIYRILVGPIPEGFTIDHLCRKTLCQNPDHMEPVSRGVNSLRGTGPTALNAAKTCCPKGHEYFQYRNERRCATCEKIRHWGRRRGLNFEEAFLVYNPEKVVEECSFDGCNKDRSSKGLCKSHWQQQYRGGILKELRY